MSQEAGRVLVAMVVTKVICSRIKCASIEFSPGSREWHTSSSEGFAAPYIGYPARPMVDATVVAAAGTDTTAGKATAAELSSERSVRHGLRPLRVALTTGREVTLVPSESARAVDLPIADVGPRPLSRNLIRSAA